MKTDFLNQELKIGDFVVVMEKDYRNFTVGKIIGFTPKQVRVIYLRWGERIYEYLTNYIVKINDEQLSTMDQKTLSLLNEEFNKKPF